MRLGIFTIGFPQYSEKFSFDRMVELVRGGIDVVVFCRQRRSSQPFQKDWEKHHFENRVVDLSFRRSDLSWCSEILPALFDRRSTKPLKEKIFERWVIKKIKQSKCSIVHFEFGPLASEFIFLKEACPEIKFITSFRGYGLHTLNRYDFKRVFDQGDAFHFISRYLLQQAQKSGYSGDQHCIIPPAIDESLFSNSKQRKKGNVLKLIACGRLHWRKGYPEMIQTIKILKEKGLSLHLKIFGSGDDRLRIEYLIQIYRLKEEVQLCGTAPREEIAQALQESDVFIHSSYQEGFCNAILEAQAVGLPVVCTTGGATSENIENQKTGLLVPPRDPEAMADAILKLWKNDELWREQSMAGPERVMAHFTLRAQTEAFSKFYHSILPEKWPKTLTFSE